MVPRPAPSAGPSAPAVSIRAHLIRSLVAVGSAWRSSAAAPATWGAEQLVPLPRRWASSTKLGYRRSASPPGARRECTLWPEIGRAPCRERLCQDVLNPVVV